MEVMHGRTVLEMLSNNQTRQPMTSCLPYQKDKFNRSIGKANVFTFQQLDLLKSLCQKNRTPTSFRVLHSFQMLRLQTLQDLAGKDSRFRNQNELIGFGLTPAANNTVEM